MRKAIRPPRMSPSQLHALPGYFLRGVVIMAATYAAVQLIPCVAGGLVGKPTEWMRQGVRGLEIFTVYRVGAHLLKSGLLIRYWQTVYGLGSGYLFLVAALEYGSGPVPFGIRASVAPVVELLISPIIFIAAGLLYYRLDTPNSAG